MWTCGRKVKLLQKDYDTLRLKVEKQQDELNKLRRERVADGCLSASLAKQDEELNDEKGR